MFANITKTCIIINLSKCAVNLERVKLIDCQSNLEKVHIRYVVVCDCRYMEDVSGLGQ